MARESVDGLDDRLRTRLAEIRSAAGVPHSQVALECLYFLPAQFLTQYQELFSRALKSDGGESGRNTSQQQAGDLGKATGTGAKPGRRYKKAFVVLDEKALDLKSTIDKRLRMVARDIDSVLSGEQVEKAESRCPRCGTFVQNRWRYCPLDGTPLNID